MIRIGGPENTSIKLLRGWPNGLLYRPNADDSATLTEEMIEEHFTDGSSVFHDGDEFDRYFVQRVRNYGHIASLHQADISRARVDAHGCDPSHEEREVNVAEARMKIERFRSLSHQEYYTFVWGQDVGFPPFDLVCTCRMAGVIAGLDY